MHYNKGDKNAWREKFNKDFGTGPKSDRTQWCACFYKFKMPDVNMCYPPLTWQTYDFEYTAAKFDDKGKKIKHARMTVKHNGVVIHNDVECDHATTASKQKESPDAGPIYLQNHGNPVRYRNIWVVPKD